MVFTKDGEALYFHSSSELQRLSLSATKITSARCYLALPEGARQEQGSNVNSDNDDDEERQMDVVQNLFPLVNGSTESKESSVADKVR